MHKLRRASRSTADNNTRTRTTCSRPRVAFFTLITVALLAGAAAPVSAAAPASITAPVSAAATASITAPAGSVGGPSVSLSTTAAGAGKVAYTVRFAASAGGALASGSGTVTLTGPAGTVFDSNQAIYQFRDVTAGTTGTTFGFQGTSSQNGASITVPVPITIADGDQVAIVAQGAANAPGAGARQLSIATSSDTTPATAGFTLTAPSAVKSASVRLSTPAAGAADVTYTVGFTVSATGALVAGGNTDGSGEVTLAAQAGTVFNGDEASYQFRDVTTGTTGDTFGFSGVLSNGGTTITLPVPINVAAGNQVTVTAPAVTSAASGSHTLTVTTTSDSGTAKTGYALVAPSPVASPSAGVSTTAAGAKQVAYRVVFTASKTGALATDITFPSGAGHVILSGPAGTVFDHNLANYNFDDITSGKTGTSFGFQGTLSRGGAAISMPVPITISAGDKVSLTAEGVTSPAGAGSRQLTVSTSSDTRTVAAAYKLTSPLHVLGLLAIPSFIQAGAHGAVYTIGMTTSVTGALQEGAVITVTGPAGTKFPSDSADYCVQGAGASFCTSVLSVTLADSGAAASITLFRAIPAATPVVLSITAVTNGAAGSAKLAVSTSSDIVAASTVLQLIPWSGSEVTGTVSFQGAPLSGVQLLTCPVAGTPGSCESTATDGSGNFAEPTGFGTYAITATPASGTGAQAATVQVTVTSTQPVIAEAITLQKPPGLPAGTTFTNNGHTYGSGQVPVLVWEGSSSLSLTGPKDGIGLVAVTGTNTLTGAPQSVVAPLIETPKGSGKYTATLPAMYPVHGDATVHALILPPSSFPASPTDLKGGTSSGGTRLFAAVHGNVKEILFGGRPGTGLQQVLPGLYTVISPPGTGTVPMTAVVSTTGTADTSRGTSDVPMGNWLYLPLVTISSSSGPSGGGGTITFTGAPLTLDPIVIFGGDPSNDVEQTGPDSYTVSVPPGEGTEPITVDVPDVGLVNVGTYTRTDTSSNLAAELQNYYSGLNTLGTLSDIFNALTNEPGGLENLAESFFLEPLITKATGYQFVNGPVGLFTSTFLSEMLLAGPEGILLYMLTRFGANEIDKALNAGFGATIDPSGTVVDKSGRPIAGAKATLQIRTGSGGLFEAIAASSPGISPHVNPQTTGKDGRFDWLAAAGVYRVHAISASCKNAKRQPASGNTAPFTLPPPAVGLVIVLPCELGKVVRPRVTGLSPAAIAEGGGPVLVTGTGIGAATKVTLGKHAVPFVRLGSGTLRITAPPGAGSSQLLVTTPAGTSAIAAAATLHYLTVAIPPELDVQAHGVSMSAASAITAPRLTTIDPGDLLVAFVSASGPAGKAQRVTAVTGGGLRWTLVARADKETGTAEVWQARAAGTVKAAAITATLLDKAPGSITVAAFTGAGGATAAVAGSGSGAPSVSLAIPRQNSQIWAVGRDTSGTAAVKPAARQSLVYLDQAASGSGWVQAAPQGAGVTHVKVGDSAPTTVPWDLVAVAIAPVT